MRQVFKGFHLEYALRDGSLGPVVVDPVVLGPAHYDGTDVVSTPSLGHHQSWQQRWRWWRRIGALELELFGQERAGRERGVGWGFVRLRRAFIGREMEVDKLGRRGNGRGLGEVLAMGRSLAGMWHRAERHMGVPGAQACSGTSRKEGSREGVRVHNTNDGDAAVSFGAKAVPERAPQRGGPATGTCMELEDTVGRAGVAGDALDLPRARL